MAYESSQGIGFSFSGQAFTANSIQLSQSVSEIDVSSLSDPTGSYRSFRPAPIREAPELQIDFVGMALPQMTATGAISWTIAASGSNAGFTTGIPANALCTSASVTAAVGELIKGQATFRLTAT
jgi:hypothetical protein